MMSILIQGKQYYKTHEALKMVGISRATFFRWIKDGIIKDILNKDRRGWRLFTEEDIERLKKEAHRISGVPFQESIEFNLS